MKKTTKIWMVLLGMAGLTTFIPFTGQSQERGFYLKADAGGNVTLDTDLKEFFGENTTGAKVKFDPGMRFGLNGGYAFCDWFAADAELGVMANTIHEVDGGFVHDATFANVPFLVNARLQWPNRSIVMPYIGAGVGFSEAIIDAEHFEFGNTFFSGSDSEAVFAWQAFAGLRFRINDQMGVGLEYRYFEAESPSWHAEDFFGGPVSSDRMAFGRIQTHALSVAFQFRF